MDYNNKPHDYFSNTREEMLHFLPTNAKRVLDVGCGDGVFAKAVKEKNNAEVWGIELMVDEADKAKKILDKTFSGTCEDNIDNLPDDYFDVIYFNDVLEHLVDPYTVLERIKLKLKKQGRIISSIPNVRYHNTFMKVLFQKDWKYEDYGVMDITHLRFFTGKSIKRMYEEAGFRVEKHHGINRSKSLKVYLYNILFLFTALDIMYPQYVTVAVKES